MQMPSREFAKKNGQMSARLAIDATRFRPFVDAVRVPDASAPRHGHGARPGLPVGGPGISPRARARRRAEFGLQAPPSALRVQVGRSLPEHLRRTRQREAAKKTLEGVGSIRLHIERRASSGDEFEEAIYFLCRCRFRSFRCLCFRIFLRRFLITLPTGCLRAPRDSRRSVMEIDERLLVSSASGAGCRACEPRQG